MALRAPGSLVIRPLLIAREALAAGIPVRGLMPFGFSIGCRPHLPTSLFHVGGSWQEIGGGWESWQGPILCWFVWTIERCRFNSPTAKHTEWYQNQLPTTTPVGRQDLGDNKRLGHVLGAPLLHQRLAAASHVDGVSPGTLRIAGIKPNRLAAISRLILKLNASLAYPPGGRATPIQHAAMGQYGAK